MKTEPEAPHVDAAEGVFSQELCLCSAQVDCFCRLRWSTMFTLFQEASIAHFEQQGCGSDKTLYRGLLWIITLQTARIERLPYYGETVRLKTWSGEPMHVFLPRYYRIEDAEGKLLVESSALWGLMDQQTRKLVLPGEHGIVLATRRTGQEMPLPRAQHSVKPEWHCSYTVPFHVLDLNGHMNNASYFDLAQEFLPCEVLKRTPTRISAEYRGEATWGQRLTVGGCRTEEGWSLFGETTEDAPRKVFRLTLDYAEEE